MKKIAEILDELKDMGADWDFHSDDAYLFDVPKGYFDALPSQIMANIKASGSETELHIDLDKTPLFQVPEQYFDNLSSHILQKVQAMDQIVAGKEPLFKAVPAINPYQLPENYFDNLHQDILRKRDTDLISSDEEIETMSPLLASLKDKVSYKAPGAYFNETDFSERIQVKTIESKIIEHPAAKSIKWARWAAAASIVLIFSVGGLRFLGANVNITEDQKLEQSLAKIPDAQIQEWLSNNLDESDFGNLSASVGDANMHKTPGEQRVEDAENDFY
jgi:hypothetical protein